MVVCNEQGVGEVELMNVGGDTWDLQNDQSAGSRDLRYRKGDDS